MLSSFFKQHAHRPLLFSDQPLTFANAQGLAADAVPSTLPLGLWGPNEALLPKLIGCMLRGQSVALAHGREPEHRANAWLRAVGCRLPGTYTILPTSGSTGAPKAVLHAFDAHIQSARLVSQHFRFGPNKRWLLSLPLYHVGGLAIVFRAMVSGGSIVLAPKDMALQDAIYAFGVTHLSLVPTQLVRLLDMPHAVNALRCLDALILGGAPLAQSVWDRAITLGLPLTQTYGMTESASMIAVAKTQPNELWRLPESKITITATGEITLQSKALCKGYIQGGALTKVVDRAGFFHTKDRSAQLPSGAFSIEGRIDNQFISGGENIQPEDIERALSALPGVVQAVVVSKPDPTWGQRPVAFVLTHGVFSGEALARGLAGLIAPFKIPKEFRPLNPALLEHPKRTRAALKALVMSE